MVNLGHVVLYVRDIKASTQFYRQVVGLDVAGEVFNHRAAVLTGGSTHHELLLLEVGNAPGPLQGRRLGLYHIGWRIGESLDDLKIAKQRAENSVAPSTDCPITLSASACIFVTLTTMRLSFTSTIPIPTGAHPVSGYNNR